MRELASSIDIRQLSWLSVIFLSLPSMIFYICGWLPFQFPVMPCPLIHPLWEFWVISVLLYGRFSQQSHELDKWIYTLPCVRCCQSKVHYVNINIYPRPLRDICYSSLGLGSLFSGEPHYLICPCGRVISYLPLFSLKGNYGGWRQRFIQFPTLRTHAALGFRVQGKDVRGDHAMLCTLFLQFFISVIGLSSSLQGSSALDLRCISMYF